MKEIYLVTGATGHLGNVICKQLVKQGKRVRALVLNNDKLEYVLPKTAEVVHGDVTDVVSLENFFACKDDEELYVIHCAGIISIEERVDKRIYDVNVTGTKNIANFCLNKGVKKLVYVSSVHAIPEKSGIISETTDFEPEKVRGAYAKTKAEATAYVLNMVKLGLNAVVVQPSGIIGAFDYPLGSLTKLIDDIASGKLKIGVKGGYNFVGVESVSEGVIKALARGKAGECYILSGKYYSISDIFAAVSKVSKRAKLISICPVWIIKMFSPLIEWHYRAAHKVPVFTKYSLYTINTNAKFSNEKAQKELGFVCGNTDADIYKTVQWLTLCKYSQKLFNKAK